MFCNQCEQTAKGTGCTKVGVCGKTEDVAALQDLLTYALQGLALVAVEGRKVGVVDQAINRYTAEATFACLTNVDFDPARFENWINTTVQLREDLKKKVAAAGGKLEFSSPAAAFVPAAGLAALTAQGQELDFLNSLDTNEDLRSLKQITVFGLRGLAAYTDHAYILGQEDDTVYAFIHQALADVTRKDLGLDALVALA